MSYTFTDIDFFPTSSNTTVHVLEESKMPDDMRKYLLCKPSQGRLSSRWIWNAPQDIKRTDKEPGYPFAYTDLGMGHWNILYWNHTNDRWYIRLMGGANIHDATKRYKDLLENGFQEEGTICSVEEWMHTFLKN